MSTILWLGVYVLGALIMSVFLTVLYAKHPDEQPRPDQVGWKTSTAIYSIVWPIAVVGVVVLMAGFLVGSLIEGGLKGRQSPWTRLYNHVQRKSS